MRSFVTLIVVSATFFTACSKPPSRISSKDSLSNPADDDDANPVGDKLDDDNGGADGEEAALVSGFSTAFPRISHMQWENAVRDVLLLKKAPGLSKDFTADPPGSTFKNKGDLLKVSGTLWNDYREAAEKVATQVATDSEALKALVPATLPKDENELAKAVITPLARRAYRRPATAAEMGRLTEIFKNGPKMSDLKDPLAAKVESLITVILQTPQFIYRSELGTQADDNVKLTAFEIASRLSFAIWNSIPDEALLKAAEDNSLLDKEVRARQITRMLEDPKASETLMFFHQKAFNTEKYAGITPKDEKVFPNWTKDMGPALQQEAELFLKEVIFSQKGGLKEILTAPFTFINDKNAVLYGVKPTMGATFVKTNLDPNQRAGFLTQAGYLASKAHSDETDPIHRGTFIVGEIFCTKLVVPPVTEPVPPPSADLKTMRDRVSALTNGGSCKACHGGMINPAGFAFENFDASGTWRDAEGGEAVDASGDFTYIGNKWATMKFAGPVEFVKQVAANQGSHNCYTQKALEMLYGRRPTRSDDALIQSLGAKSLKGASAKEVFKELLLDDRIELRGNKEEATK